ncbi:hypothetical protein LH61_06380 [Leuconostoc mesenteroides P45]|uniref:NAD(P)H-binding protein n=1 Tax=Leuconostoc mesenteroides TaxID=1245 RepID=UPI0005027FF5|nr:NAD(P)H-binding protein [Leuconostoc mesenteroides]KGB51097.1 hypothetical protein LH61_06380 [Leuconostoc mesenteroides P45]
MTKYFLTGVTGRLGSSVLSSLLTKVPAADVTVGIRNLNQSAHFEALGVTVRHADYTQPDTLLAAFEGIDKLMLVSGAPGGEVPRTVQHRNVIEAAKQAKVDFIAYTSLTEADQLKTFLADDHNDTEKFLASSGIKHSILRNNWYLENQLDIIKKAAAGEKFVNPVGDAKIGWALIREYGEAAANILTMTSPKAIYEFGGQPRTYAELARAIAKVVGHDIPVVNKESKLPEQPDIWEKIEWQMQHDISQGVLTYHTNDLADVLGREPDDLQSAVAELL